MPVPARSCEDADLTSGILSVRTRLLNEHVKRKPNCSGSSSYQSKIKAGGILDRLKARVRAVQVEVGVGAGVEPVPLHKHKLAPHIDRKPLLRSLTTMLLPARPSRPQPDHHSQLGNPLRLPCPRGPRLPESGRSTHSSRMKRGN